MSAMTPTRCTKKALRHMALVGAGLAVVVGCAASPQPIAIEVRVANDRPSIQADGGENGRSTREGKPNEASTGSPLNDCMRAALRSADVDAALADCEEKHVGRGWRAKVVPLPDGGTVRGRLEPVLIQAALRAQFVPFRTCYEDGLRRDPSTHGRVAVRFKIGPTGHVAEARRDDSTGMKDREVVDCVVREFGLLRFSRPEGGSVTVIYPIIFNPGE